MSYETNNTGNTPWTAYRKIAFRFVFIFLLLLSLPLDYTFYVNLFSAPWLSLRITDLLSLAAYTPDFFSEHEKTPWSLASFASWGLIFLVALVGTFAWTLYENRNKQSPGPNYDKLYYWLRVILRYRLGFALIAYGIIKVFPLQMPFPSLSNLHTNYGDFLPWKIYFQTVGIAPNYETFLGVVEVAAGVLLFFRNKVTFGTGIILGFIGNVLFANISYEIGTHVLATYIVLVAVFLFAHDIPRLYNLLALERPTQAERFVPDFSAPLLQRLRIGLKACSFLILAFFIVAAYLNFSTTPYLLPQGKALANSFGFYNVKHFVLNKDTLPYTRSNPDRWQNVIFEKWSTISIKTAKPVKVDYSIVKAGMLNDIDRVYESAGVGDRRYFNYTIDAENQTLQLNNKNALLKDENFQLSFTRPNDSTIIVRGVNEKKDSITAYLERIDRKYMLIEGRRKPVKL